NISELYLHENIIELEPSALSGLTSLTGFTVAENNTALCADDGVLYNKDKTQLLYFPSAKNVSQYTVPESVVEICANCFGSCKYLKDIYVGAQVTTVTKRIFEYTTKPLVHTPTGSAMELLCIENDIAYDNIM
ncbi:MAG: leucine-rich repeat domain-containing protein, partial [Ruminococcus sp.]|nr:leucine-rich repeat domain-containing protein [Ruminococcus sp.]